jgi:hypothetical protein
VSIADGQGAAIARRLLGFGSANATELFALRYAIESITLATTLSSTGSAYDLTGSSTWTIYRGSDTAGDYDSFDSEHATLVGPNHPDYVDLMNATQRASLSQESQPLTALQATKEYNFIVINWKRPIFVKAQVAWNSTHTLYSKRFGFKTGDCGVETAGNCATHTNLSMWDAPAEDVALELNNGGAWARLAQPFRPNGGGDFRVVLAFNPDGLVTAAPAGLVSTPSGLWDAADNHMSIPFLALNPVVVQGSALVMKESYLLHHPATTCVANDNYIRVELYYLDGAPAVIWAVDAIGQHEAPPRYTSWVSQTFFLEGEGDGPYIFRDWSQTAFLSGFYRGINSTAQYHSQCGGGYNNTFDCCVTVNVNVTRTHTSLVDF